MGYITDQEKFWAGEFGTDYIDRNKGKGLLASNINFFTKSLRSTQNIRTVIEFGANVGMNLLALRALWPDQVQHAVEINHDACSELANVIPQKNIFEGSILEYSALMPFDLVLIKGVLIHINPSELPKVYERLVKSCSKYLLVAEYYNPTPVAIGYRGHIDRLFKRDFAGEIMTMFPEMKLIDYGFSYHKDPNFPQDDITWFLMRKEALDA